MGEATWRIINKNTVHVFYRLFVYFGLCFFVSFAKKNLPPQSEITRQNTAGRLHNNPSVSQNSQRSDHGNNNEQDDSMFNDDDDDDLDITEIDQAVLDGKAPESSQKTEERDDKIINHKDSVKTNPVSRSQRYMFHCVIAVHVVFEQRINSDCKKRVIQGYFCDA